MEDGRMLEIERHQIEQIRELEFEELQIEEVEGLHDADGDADNHPLEHANPESGTSGGISFNPCLAALHTYLGEVEDTTHGLVFLDGGAILSLPLLCLEGVVLFPEATLPLRLIHPSYVACVNKALNQVDAPDTFGVVRVSINRSNGGVSFAFIGTTAKIRQLRRLEDGSLNLLTRGQQRFRVRRRWLDEDRVTCGEVQIIEEDFPLRAPKDAFGKLPATCGVEIHSSFETPSPSSHLKQHGGGDAEGDSEACSAESFENELSIPEIQMHRSVTQSCCGYDTIDESTSSDEEKFVCESELQLETPQLEDEPGSSCSDDERYALKSQRRNEIFPRRRASKRNEGWKTGWNVRGRSMFCWIERAFWPYWVYSMYDSYCLAQKAAGMWKKIVGSPSMDCLAKEPGLLSFSIASKIPVSEATRQELLEIDGISYRLQREIKLLESFDRIRCKSCQTVIGRRSDMLVMSIEGPLGAYVNPYGFVHEVLTFHQTNDLVLSGSSSQEYSWFPGYSWTVANCSTCESQMGWMFTAVDKMLQPRTFWAIRSSQVGDDMQ